MTILTVASSKGGAGKTTLAQCLAANMAALGYAVTVIDADNNASLSNWHSSAYEGPAFACIAETGDAAVVDVAREAAERSDVVIIDTAGFANVTASMAMAAANFVVIPCMPDRSSVSEAIKTAKRVESLAKAAGRTLPYRLIGLTWRPGGQVEGATLAALAAASVPMLSATLPTLTEFRKASFSGRMPVGGRIGREADKLVAELIGLEAIPAAPHGVAEVA